jgi:hypothetical protein
MNGIGGVTLDKPITVTGYLDMEYGILTSSSTNLVTIGSSVSIWSALSSFVNGPVACVNATAGAFSKMYPIGKGSIYRPITLSLNQTAATSSTYKAEMFNVAPPSYALPGDLSLDKVSSVRYYNIEEAGGGSAFTAGAVTLSYDVDDAVTNSAALRIVKTDGSNWGNLVGSGTANTTGTITSTIPFGNITSPRTIFTLANAKGGGNPLLVGLTSNVPKVFALEQNYPNPFNPSTIISYQVASLSNVSLKVYDLLGREIATLVNEMKSAGSYTATFNAANMPSGVYYYKLKAGNYSSVKKLLLLK